MKKFFFTIACFLVTVSGFSQDIAPANKGTKYGAKISAKGAVPASQLSKKMGAAPQLDARVSGKVVEVCEKKGCFMKIDLENGETMRVTFKDYGFFVPQDIKGKTVVVDGFAKQELVSVEDQKHFAEDAKKPASEIEKITKPKQEVTFEAKGVVVL